MKCMNKSCPAGKYQCKYYHYCIPPEFICDGIKHCLFGDDEENCQNSLNIFIYYKLKKNKILNIFFLKVKFQLKIFFVVENQII